MFDIIYERIPTTNDNALRGPQHFVVSTTIRSVKFHPRFSRVMCVWASVFAVFSLRKDALGARHFWSRNLHTGDQIDFGFRSSWKYRIDRLSVFLNIAWNWIESDLAGHIRFRENEDKRGIRITDVRCMEKNQFPETSRSSIREIQISRIWFSHVIKVKRSYTRTTTNN